MRQLLCRFFYLHSPKPGTPLWSIPPFSGMNLSIGAGFADMPEAGLACHIDSFRLAVLRSRREKDPYLTAL